VKELLQETLGCAAVRRVGSAELAAVLGAERFVQEIKTTASVQHPHILPLFDSGDAHSFLFYVMPYVEGESQIQHVPGRYDVVPVSSGGLKDGDACGIEGCLQQRAECRDGQCDANELPMLRISPAAYLLLSNLV
jgi:hypothetical protein